MLTDPEIKMLRYASGDAKYGKLDIQLKGETLTFKRLWEYHQGPLIAYGAEKMPIVQKLVELGLCRLAAAKAGPLGIDTGEFFLKITKKGKDYLERPKSKSLGMEENTVYKKKKRKKK